MQPDKVKLTRKRTGLSNLRTAPTLKLTIHFERVKQQQQKQPIINFWWIRGGSSKVDYKQFGGAGDGLLLIDNKFVM